MYKLLIRPLFFLFDPEFIHHFTFRLLKLGGKIPFFRKIIRYFLITDDMVLQREFFGITFPNPVGLAAGFDKDAKAVDELSDFGFGFIEIGTVTPKPQEGNNRPRLFRLTRDAAAAERLRKRHSNVIIGGNIGKNKTTPNDQAENDYLSCFETLYPVVDYFVVNVSSPNTPNLRELQDKVPLTRLLMLIQEKKLLNMSLIKFKS